MLTGLYNFTRIYENNQAFVENKNRNSSSSLFGENSKKVINKVAVIAALLVAETQARMEEITVASLAIVRENFSENFKDEDVKNFLTSQRYNILLHLHP
ncbi:MAG: hypothetical protein ABIN25_01890 [Ginsengibacter sp.]